jgi:hypothetical protein
MIFFFDFLSVKILICPTRLMSLYLNLNFGGVYFEGETFFFSNILFFIFHY